ncbi:MAG: alpha/beta hydrolase [Sphingomonadaceae bacterium]
MLLKLILGLALLYAAAAALLFLAQDSLLFPTRLVEPAAPLPAAAERLTLAAPGGVRLEGVHIPPRGEGDGESGGGATLLLGFAGNATNAQNFALLLHELYPAHGIAAFHYRGYAPSGGEPDARALIEDALRVHDMVARRYEPRRVVAVGMSLGSGVAAALAAERELAGLVLVTPFDSLQAAARQLYFFMPVSLLLRHELDAAGALREADVPVAIVAAGRDRVIPPARTEALREVVPNLVYDRTIEGAGHNDIVAAPGFAPAMREALAAVLE